MITRDIRRAVALLVLLTVAAVSDALAHPGHDHEHEQPRATNLRTWTESHGVFRLEASYVAARDGKVQLRKADGQLVSWPIVQLTAADQQWIANRQAEIDRLQQRTSLIAFAPSTAAKDAAPVAAMAFEPFVQRKAVTTRWDDRYLYVESNGMPDHPLMIGIRSWQQQVPLPQKYVGENAWQIPLKPKPAAQPASAKNRFLRGAIALAVNGIPIFNPLNNRGDDAYLFGELDEYGGHCGRADDYHYHIAPVHLEKQVGRGSILAYALDGYPIYGFEEADGSPVTKLDALNGHKDAAGNYHYHATKTYPYLNGGFYGEVVEREGQVDPQPRAQPVREFLQPLDGAKITDFKQTEPGSYQLTYDQRGRIGHVRYRLLENGSVQFTFVDSNGQSRTETYAPRGRGREGKPGGDRPARKDEKPERGPKPDRGQKPPRDEKRPSGNKPPRGDEGPPPKPNDPPGSGQGPAPGAARRPWIAEHFAELDSNQDGQLTRDEMKQEATRTFAAYDSNRDGRLDKSEYDRGGVRTAFAGFVRGHAAEVDANRDGIITRDELLEFADQLFQKSDRNRDGRSTEEEATATGGDRGRKPE